MKGFNYRLLARITGTLLLVLAAAMLLPVAVSLHCRDGSQYALLMSAVLMGTLGLMLRNMLGRRAEYVLREVESFWITAVVWLVIPLGGMLPYLFSGTCSSFTDAAFESVSGFTTTGSSVVPVPEEVPQGVLLWRSMTQWIGGLGLVLLVVATARRLQVGSLRLYEAEFSGTQQRKLHPKIATSVSRMWHIYTLITVLMIVLLRAAGNGGLDSVCLALSTVSTGGFMTAQYGMAGYSNATLAIMTVFMFLSGVNVALLYNLFTFRWRQLRRTEELGVYVVISLVAVVASTLSFALSGTPWVVSLCYSLFHIAATVSTCGFYTTPPAVWPMLPSAITFLLILCGAMAGSTCGGLKLRRIMTLALYLRNYFTRMLHPSAVFTIKIDRRVVPGEYVNKIFGFMFLYACFITGGAFLLTIGGCSISEAFCLAAANISNLGPSPLINTLGASLDYAALPLLSKWTLMALMLAGRLEIFALIAIFTPAYWRRPAYFVTKK